MDSSKRKVYTWIVSILCLLLVGALVGVSVYFTTKGKSVTDEIQVEKVDLNEWTNTAENLSYYENSCINNPSKYTDEIVPEYQKFIDNKVIAFDEKSPLNLKINIYENGKKTKVVNSDLFYATQTLTTPDGDVVSNLAYVNSYTLMQKLGLNYQCAYMKFSNKYNKNIENNSLNLAYGKDFSSKVEILDKNATLDSSELNETSLFPMMYFSELQQAGKGKKPSNVVSLQEPVLEFNVYFTNSVLDFMDQPDYIK